MAANTSVNSVQEDVEPVVNRWIVDFYYSQALDVFKGGQYEDFCAIKTLLDQFLLRPVENTDTLPTKLQVLQFLSLINDCEKLEPASPLESALNVLEKFRHICNVAPQDFKSVSASIKDMIVGNFIKSNKFDKAKAMLLKHFPKSMVGKTAIFMGLIAQKSHVHEVIEQINYQQFKKEMVVFCQQLCPPSVPFLCKAARQLVEKRSTEQDSRAAGSNEKAQQTQAYSSQTNNAQLPPRYFSVIQRTRLEAAYRFLAADKTEKAFAQLESEMESEEEERQLCLQLSPDRQSCPSVESECDGQFQRDAGSPMEASPADQPPQMNVVPETQAGSLSKVPPVQRSRKPFSVARLVVEQDSQPSSQCTNTSQKKDTEAQPENRPQTPSASSRKSRRKTGIQEAEIPVSQPKHPRTHSRESDGASTSRNTFSSDKVDDSPVAKSGLHNQSSRSPRGNTKPVQMTAAGREDAEQRRHKRPARNPLSKERNTPDKCYVSDSLVSEPGRVQPSGLVPQKSSTPNRVPNQSKSPTKSKWKVLYENAKESKETWSDDESPLTFKKSKGLNESSHSESSQRRKMWTDRETQMLREGVKKFGEGNWSQIKDYYSFHDRTNVNLKDRWRTMQKLKMV